MGASGRLYPLRIIVLLWCRTQGEVNPQRGQDAEEARSNADADGLYIIIYDRGRTIRRTAA